jgi:hypothetical protein
LLSGIYISLFLIGQRILYNDIIFLSVLVLTIGISIFLSKNNFRSTVIVTVMSVIYSLSFLIYYVYDYAGKAYPGLNLALFTYLIYIMFHVVVMYSFFFELHDSNLLGLHKIYISIFDNKEIEAFLKTAEYSPHSKHKYVYQRKPIENELEKGLKEYPQYVIEYLVNNSYQINLINEIITHNERFHNHYHDGIKAIFSEFIQEMLRLKDPNIQEEMEEITLELLQLNCSPKLITEEIDKSNLENSVKQGIKKEYQKYWLLRTVYYHDLSDQTLLHHGYTIDQINEHKTNASKISNLVEHMNKLNDIKHKIFDMQKVYSNQEIKDALFISGQDVEIKMDKHIHEKIFKEGDLK